jgi:thiamine-monophosphate kinase
LSRSPEHVRIAALRERFAVTGSASAATEPVALGIGDDCAVLAPQTDPMVVSIDAAVEGTHFRRDWMDLEDVGFRATMAALSDLAAMGARPIGVLSALVLPSATTDEELFAIAEGQRAATLACGTSVIGGNLARGTELSITTTVLGVAAVPLRRDGARPGDQVWIAGAVGWSALGLLLLERGIAPRSDDDRRALSAFRRPHARLADGLAASSRAHAAIDVSDGLAADVAHVAGASRCRIELDAAAIRAIGPGSALTLGRDPLALALHGGEDYALVVTAPRGVDLPGFVAIGACDDGPPGEVWIREDHASRRVEARGFDHFAPSGAVSG